MTLQPGFDGEPAIFVPSRDIGGEGKRKVGTFRKFDRLLWMREHKRIEQYQFDAGQRLQTDVEQAELIAYATLGAVPGGSGSERLSDAKCDAIARVNAVKTALRGIPWRIVELVVIDGMTVDAAEVKMGLRYRAGYGALLGALDNLSAHYGLI